MKRFFTLLISFSVATTAQSQTPADEIIKLATISWYGQFGDDPKQETLNELSAIKSESLLPSREFIREMIKSNNEILSPRFLSRPDSSTLQVLFTVRALMWNKKASPKIDELYLVDSLNKFPASKRHQLASYYDLLFGSTVNKIKPESTRDLNFTIDEYGLKDSTEKAIFFLESIRTFGMRVWGYMVVPKPPNYEAALSAINTFPKYNGQPYYTFRKLYFPDFDVIIDKKKGRESFKKFYINKYLRTLSYHASAAGRINETEDEQKRVLNESILNDETYFKYSDDPETFRQIIADFKKE